MALKIEKKTKILLKLGLFFKCVMQQHSPETL